MYPPLLLHSDALFREAFDQQLLSMFHNYCQYLIDKNYEIEGVLHLHVIYVIQYHYHNKVL
jgi:hypothetical protein